VDASLHGADLEIPPFNVCCLPLQYFQPCHYVSCRNPMLLSVAFVYFLVRKNVIHLLHIIMQP